MSEELYFILSACVVVAREEAGSLASHYLYPRSRHTFIQLSTSAPMSPAMAALARLTPHGPENRSEIHHELTDELHTQTRTTSEYDGVLVPLVRIRENGEAPPGNFSGVLGPGSPNPLVAPPLSHLSQTFPRIVLKLISEYP